MNARKFLNFFKSKTGHVTAFGLLFFIGACLLTGVLYFRHTSTAPVIVLSPKIDQAPQKPSSWISDKPDADFANKHGGELGNVPASPNGAPAAPAVLPIALPRQRPASGGFRHLRAVWKNDSMRDGHHH